MTSARQRRLRGFIADDRDRTGIFNDWFRVVPFIRYDPETGEILEKGTESIAGLKHLAEKLGHHYLPVSGDFETYYVDVEKERRRVRRVCPAVLDGLTLRDLPQPCRIEISEQVTGTQVYDETEAMVELSFDHPGTYTVRVLSVPFTPGEFVVTI